MTQRLTSLRYLPFVLFVVLSASFGLSFGQTATVVNNAALPRFQTPDQQTVEVKFDDGAGGAITLTGTTTAAQWTVKVNGVAALITGTVPYTGALPYPRISTAFPNFALVTFDASGVSPGHPAWILPGETLTVAFNNIGNTLTTSGSGNAAASFTTAITCKNAYVPTCADINYRAAGIAGTPDICAPVNTAFAFWCYRSTLLWRNSSKWVTTQNVLVVSWKNPANTVTSIPGYLSNDGGTPNSNFTSILYTGGLIPEVFLSYRTSFDPVLGVSDATKNPFSYPAGTGLCNFNSVSYPFNAAYYGCNSGTNQRTVEFTSFDYDNQTPGLLGLTPSAPLVTLTSQNVCLGTNVNVKYTDASTFNCMGDGTFIPNPSQGAANGPVNSAQRWVRFIYGGANSTVPASNIPDIHVNGFQVTDPATGALNGALVSNPNITGAYATVIDTSPNASPMQNGYVVPGSAGPAAGSPDQYGVIALPNPGSNATTSGLVSQLITTTTAAAQVVGQKFYVTVQYWNACNPYPFSTPVEYTTILPVNIISNQNAPAANPLTFCANQANTAYQMTASTNGPAAAGTFKWYSDAALTVNRQTGATYNPVSSAPNVSKTPAAATTTNFYLTETLGNGCVSPTTTVPFTIDPAVVPGSVVYSGSSPLCTGSDPPSIFGDGVGGVAVHGAVATKGDGVSYTYQWQDSPDNITFTNIAGQTGANFDPPILAATRYYKRIAHSGVCTDVASNVITIQIDQHVVGGDIGGNQTICTGSIPASLTNATSPTGGNGTFTYQWQFSTVSNTGPFSNAPGTSTNATYTAPAALTQTTYYIRNASSGVCTGTNGTQPSASVVTVTVNQAVSAGTVSGDQAICAGSTPTPLTSVLPASGGDGTTYTYQWQQAAAIGGPYSAASGANNALTYSPPALTTTTFYRRQATSGVCAVAVAGPLTVTVNPLPTAAVSGGGASCNSVPAPDVIFTMTGTGPWDVIYTISGVTQPTLTSVTSPYNIVNPGNGTFVITSVKDDGTNCTSTSPSANITGSAIVTTSLTLAPSKQFFTATAPVCDNGGSTVPPTGILDLSPDQVATYDLTYTFNGHTHTLTSQTSDASGILPAIAPPYSDWGSVPGSYVITVTALKNTATGCAGPVPFTSASLIVNARPSTPTGGIGATACSNAATGATIKVTDPGAGFTIEWFTNSAGTIAAIGTTGGTRGEQFTPTSTATVTYYAFTFSTVAPTLCQSSAGLAVVHTQDVLPAAANAGAAQPNVCASSASVTLAGNTATNGGTGTWTGPVGVGFGNLHSPTSTATGLPKPTPGNAPITTTLTWTIASALGVCGNSSSTVDITYNPLPTSTDPTPQLCEDVAGGGSHAGVDLTSYNASVTNGATVNWWTNVAHTTAVASPTNTVVNNSTAKTFYFTSISSAPFLCQNSGTLTFTVNSLPTVVTQNLSFCEDNPFPPHSNQHGPFDLTAYNTAIANGSLTNRTVTWYSNSALTTLVPSPTSYTLTGPTQTLYAKVTDTSKPTNCFNTATVNLTIKPRPADNPINGNTSVCTGNNIILYQLDPTLNSGSTYTWSVVGTPAADVTVFGGGGTNTSNFFVLLKFPSATGTVAIDVFETLNGCTGNTQHMTVNVNAAPAPNTITGSTQVCANQTAVPYSVTSPNGSSTYAWTVVGATPSGSGSLINVDFSTISPVTIQVTETAVSGCAGAPATATVTVNQRPTVTFNGTPTVCSSQAPTSLTFSSGAIPSNFLWKVFSVTGVTGATAGQTGSGDLSTTFTGGAALKNVTGVAGSVTFNVTPVATAAPNCQGTTQSVVLTVNPEPVLVTPQTKPICSGSQVNYEILLSPTNLPTGTLFSWAKPAMQDLSTQGSAGTNVPEGPAGTIHIADVLTNPATAPITADYFISPTTTSGCSGQPQHVVITVNPIPVLTSTLTPTAICSGTTFSYTPASATTGAAFNWSRAALSGISEPAASASGNVSETLTNTTSAPITVIYAYTITANGCPKTQNVSVVVNPKPTLSSTLTPPAICSATTFSYTPSSATTGATFSWTRAAVTGISQAAALSPTGPISETLTNTTALPITVTYVYTIAANGCSNTQNVTVVVNPIPALSSTLAPSGICSGSAFNYNPTSGTPGATFSWSRAALTGIAEPAAPSTSGPISEPSLTNTTTANITVTYVVVSQANGCSNSQNVQVVVKPIPVLSSTLSPPAICSGTHFVYSATSATALATFSWTRATVSGISPAGTTGSGDVNELLTNTTVVPITVTYSYITTANACSDLAQSVTVTVNPIPSLSSTLSPPAICSGTTFNYTPASATPGATFSWSRAVVTGISEAASSSPTGTVSETLTNTTAIPIVVTYVFNTSANSCNSTPQNVQVTVNPNPQLNSTLSPPDQCSGAVFSYTPTSATLGATFGWSRPPVTGITTTSTSPGVGAINETLTNTTPSALPLTYTFTVTANGCSGTPQDVIVNVNPNPVLSSSLTPTAICSGNSFVYTPTSTASGIIFSWSRNPTTPVSAISEPVTSSTGPISETLTNTTTAPVSVTYVFVLSIGSVGTCNAPPQNVTVVVNPTPVLSSTLSPPDICNNTPFTYNPTSATAGATFAWSRIAVLGISNPAAPTTSGSVHETLVNTITDPVLVTYSYVVTANGCSGPSQSVSFNVNPTPLLSSSLTPPDICSGTNFIYTPTSATSGSTFSWSRAAVAGITQSASSGTTPIAEPLTNTQSFPVAVTYVFVTTANGCAGPPQNVIVNVNPTPLLNSSLTPPAICSTATFSYTPASATSGTVFGWSRPAVAGIAEAAATSSGPSGAVNETLTNTTTAPIPVIYFYTLTANGCSNSQSVTVMVNPIPVLSSTLTPPDVCSGSPFSYGMTSATAGATFDWSRPSIANITPSVGAMTNVTTIAETLTNSSGLPITVNYSVTIHANGCTNSQTVSVVINPLTAAQPFSTIERCSGAAINFQIQDIINNVTTDGVTPSVSGGNNVASNFTYEVTADHPLEVTPPIFTGTFDRNTAKPDPITDSFSNLNPNTYHGDVTVSYKITPYTVVGNCVSPVFTLKVVYHPQPVGNDFPDTQCATTLNHNIQSQITNSVSSVFTYTVSSNNAGVPPAPDRTVASAAFITDVYTNNTGTPAILTYLITPFSAANGCQGTPFSYFVTVSPTPVASTPTSQSVLCSRDAIDIDPQTKITNGVTATFTWTAIYDANLTGGTGSGSGHIKDKLTNLMGNVLYATYSVIPSSGPCAGLPFTIIQPVNPEPVMDPLKATAQMCSNNAASPNTTNVTLGTNGISVAAVTYDVALISKDIDLVGTPTTGTNLSSTAIKNDAFTNTGALSLKVVYQVTPKSVDGCYGAPFSITLTVNPEPVVALLSNTVCSKDPANITLATNGSSVGAASYTLVSVSIPPIITADAGNVANLGLPRSGSVGLIASDKYSNLNSGQVSVIYNISATSGTGCKGQPQVITLNINPEPILVPGAVEICSGVAPGAAINLGTQAGSAAIVQYNLKQIFVPDSLTASGTNAGLGDYTVNTFLGSDKFTNVTKNSWTVTYTIAPVASGSCIGGDYTVNLKVDPAPGLAILDATVCTSSTSGIVLKAASTSITASTYNINNVVIGSGLSQMAGNTGVRAGVGDAEIKNDKFNNTSSGISTVRYTVVPVSAANCKGPSKDIVLTVEPTLVVTPVATNDFCSNTSTYKSATSVLLSSPSVPSAGPITFSYTTTSSVGGSLSGYSRTASNVPNSTTLQDSVLNLATGVATLTYSVTAVANGARGGAGCSGTPAVIMVKVEPKPKLVVSPGIATICEGVPTNFVLTSATVPSAGTIQFNSNFMADLGLSKTSGAPGPYTSGQSIADVWSNDSIVQKTVVYKLLPVINGGLGCSGDSVSITLNVNPLPKVTPTIVSPTSGIMCSNDLVDITLSADVSSTINSWTVAVLPGGTASGQSKGSGDEIFQTLKNTGTTPAFVVYNITPTASKCVGTPVPVQIEVDPIPTVAFSAPKSVCYGDPLNVPFTSAVSGVSFEWKVDVNNSSLDTATVTSSGISYAAVQDTLSSVQDPLNFTVIGVGPNGCASTQKNFIVNASAKLGAKFLNDNTAFCGGTKDFLQIQLQGQSPFSMSYTDGTSSFPLTKVSNFKSIPIQPATNTTYQLTSMTDVNGCTVALSDQVTFTVYAKVAANFNIPRPVPKFIGGNSQVIYTNTSTPVDPSTFTYIWSFGEYSSPDSVFNGTDPGYTASPGPYTVNYSHPGRKTITLTAYNTAAQAAGVSCKSIRVDTINIKLIPLFAEFKINPKVACFPTKINVTENHSTGDQFKWYVIDNLLDTVASSNAPLPVFSISSDGVYEVGLITSNSFTGQTATDRDTVTLYPKPDATFYAAPTIVYVPDQEVSTTNLSLGTANQYLWDFGDGDTSTDFEPKHKYKFEGVDSLKYTAQYDHGDGVVCSTTSYKLIVAKQGGVAKIPNAFTPSLNGPTGGVGGVDLYNYVFLPQVKGVEEFNMQIYDRWGNLIFESTNQTIGWDGYDQHGKLLPSGVYVYKLTLRLSDQQRTTQVGDVTLIR